MALRATGLREKAIRREVSLGVPRCLQPLQAPLPLPGRRLGVCGAVVEVAVRAMFPPPRRIARGAAP